MSYRKVSFVQNEFYHIYNRGNSKQNIFRDKRDYARFQALLFIANGTSPIDFREVQKNDIFEFDRGEVQVHIGAYCLMPNHFHMLLTPAVDYGVESFLKKLSTGYSMYFNKKYERTGGLFEGRFKSEYAGTDEYLKYLFSYIHLNPVKLIQSDWKEKGIQSAESALRYLETYNNSSFIDYSSVVSEGPTFGDYITPTRKEGSILTKSFFPEYFETPEVFKKEIFEWITFNKQP